MPTHRPGPLLGSSTGPYKKQCGNPTGERVYRLRMEQALTLQKLSEKSGVSRTAINLIENTHDISNIRAVTLGKLSKALHVTLDYLLFGE